MKSNKVEKTGMKSFLFNNRLLAAIIAFSLLTAFYVDFGRISAERQAKSYDIIIDYHELEKMAEQSDRDVDWWLAEFRKMGIDKAGLGEETLISLTEDREIPVSATMMSAVMEKADWRADYPADFLAELDQKGYDEFDVLIEADSPGIFNFIADALADRFEQDQFMAFSSGGGGLIVMNGDPRDTLYSEKYKNLNSKGIGFTEQDKIISSKLMYVNLGLMDEKVKRIESAGMEVIPRTAGYEGWNGRKFAESVLEGYGRLARVPEYAIFSGEETIGYDDGTEFITDYLKSNGVTAGLIENTTQLQNIMQKGLDEIVPATGYNAVRVFTVWGYIQNRYQYYGYEGSEEIENTLFRAIVERNIRIIYFKPMMEYKDNHTYITDVDEYRNLLERVEERTARHGFSMGKASVMPARTIPLAASIIMALGCVAAAILLLRSILPFSRKVDLALLALGAIGTAGLFKMAPSLAMLAFSFAASVLFACFAAVYIMRQSKHYETISGADEKIGRIVARGAWTLTIAVAIALLGGLLTAGQISDISYMLEMNIFRGVKASQLLPLAFFPLAYLAYFGFGKLKTQQGRLEFRDLKDMMNSSIKIWMVLIGMAGVAIGVYYILRTGHDSEIMPSTFEMLMRNTLEKDLIARPRTKEFLFAFPAIMLLVYTSSRKFTIWPAIFGVASVIGLTSVINTFMHIRTPMYLGLARTGYSLLFGILAGIIGIIGFELVYRIYKRYERQRAADE